jgi:hypothetical protein
MSTYAPSNRPVLRPPIEPALTASVEAPHRYGTAFLYTDGSGSATREIEPERPDQPRPGIHGTYNFVLDEADLFSMVVDGLDLVVRHATDRCGASGQAIAALTLVSPRDDPTLRIVQTRGGIFSSEMGVRALALPYKTSVGLDLSAMRTSGQGLLLGARLLIEDLMHSIGTAEPYLVAGGGQLRRSYTTRQNHAWADGREVPITDEVIADG